MIYDAVFGKTMKYVRKHRDIKLVTTKRRRNSLAPESNYHTAGFLIESFIAIQMKKTEILMNKSV